MNYRDLLFLKAREVFLVVWIDNLVLEGGVHVRDCGWEVKVEGSAMDGINLRVELLKVDSRFTSLGL